MPRKKVVGTPVKIQHRKRKAIGEATNTLYTSFDEEGTRQAKVGILNRMQEIEKQVALEEGLNYKELMDYYADPEYEKQLMQALKKVPEYWKLKTQYNKLN